MSKVCMSPSAGRAAGFALVLVVGAFGSLRVARADDAPSNPPETDSAPSTDEMIIARMVPSEPLAADDAVSITADDSTFLLFPAGINVTKPGGNDRVVTFVRVFNWLFLQAVANAPIGATAMVEVSTKGYPPTSIPVRVQSADKHSRDPLIVLPRGKMAASRREAAAKHQAEIDAVRAEERRKLDAAVKAAWEQALLEEVHADEYRVIRLEDQGCEGEAIALCGDVITRTKRSATLKLYAENRTSQEVGADSLRASVVSESNRADHAISQRVTDNEDRPVSTIAPGQRVKVTVLLSEPEKLGNKIRVVLAGAAPVLPADRYLRIPNTWEWAENERRKERIEREAKRVSLHLVASYGAIWLPSGADGREDLKAANLKGFGIRYTKGLWPMLALEAEIGGATSGTADYGTVTVDGTEGELTRSAKLGRVQFGGALRFGDRVVPTLRAGLGLQVVNQDASMMTAGGERPGPGSDVAVGMGAYMGAGVDVKLGANLIAGASFSFTQSTRPVLDFGLNLAYRWDAVR